MKTVITGASGFVGAHLVRALVARDERPLCLYKSDKRALDGLGLDCRSGDITDRQFLAEAFSDADQVFHLAAQIDIDRDRHGQMLRINGDGARIVAEEALRARVGRLVHLSSVHAFEMHPLHAELDESRSLSLSKRAPPYDRSKAAGQRAVEGLLEDGLNALFVHPTAIMGPGDFRPSPIGRMLIDLFTGRMSLIVKGGFDWVDVRDVVEALLAVADRGTPGHRYLVNGTYLTFADLAHMTASHSKQRSKPIALPIWLAWFGLPFIRASALFSGKLPRYTGDALRFITQAPKQIDRRKAEEELGYTPRPIEETVADAFRSFEKAGLLLDPAKKADFSAFGPWV